jgi:RND family efflux transporter MFP subunit
VLRGVKHSTASKTPNSERQINFKFQISNFSATGGLALAVCLSLLAGCGRKGGTTGDGPASPPVVVRVQAAETKPAVAVEEVVGTIRARLRATLEAKVSGRISLLPVLLGQKVPKGQVVARLDAAEINARLEQARAALEQTERDWKRAAALYENQTITRAELDAAESRRRVAQAAVAEAEAMMAYVEIAAPFDGVITRKWVEVGDLATPGKPLVDMEDPALQMDADLPETVSGRVHAGDRLEVAAASVSGRLQGTVSELAPMADATTRTFRVKLDLPRTAGLMSGQFARLFVPVGECKALRVPASAVVRRGQLEMVFVVADKRAQMRLVKTGQELGKEVEVLAGLDAGEMVVVENAQRLRDGQLVEAK